MPRIRDNVRDCAVYLYPSVAAAKAGHAASGSGFLVGLRSKTDDQWNYPYVVTNRRAISEGATIVRLNTKAGETDIVELSPTDWLAHPGGDDLAAASISLHSDYHNYMLVNEPPMFLTREWMSTFRLGLGDDVFMVGRLIDHDGRQQNSPTVRFGQIAMTPGDLVRQVDGRMQECFLVDVQSIGGFSGSPVFVTVHNLRLHNPMEFNHEWYPHLLGINCGQIARPLRLLDESTGQISLEPLLSVSNKPVLPIVQNGLMMVLPAWRIADLLNQPRFLKMRMSEDARRHAKGAG